MKKDTEEDIKKNLLRMGGEIKRVFIDDGKRILLLDVREGETDAEAFKRYAKKKGGEK